MAKLNSKKQKKSLFYREKSLVGLTPVQQLKFHITAHWKLMTSDRPKFGSVPLPAEISSRTEISVSVPAELQISVQAKISVQNEQ